MRKALIIGINYYKSFGSLYGCVNDAQSVSEMFKRNADDSFNFDTHVIVASDANRTVTRSKLRTAMQELFAGDSEVALLYFAGHGHVEATGGYLCPSDVSSGDDGIALAEIMTWANQSRARHKVIILDSCHSGVAGKSPLSQVTELSDGMTILTASTEDQYANEENGSGVFTALLVDALSGAAANLLGDVTPGSVYAHIDQSLGAWAQRPVFKTNVKKFVSLRSVHPPLEVADLRRISDFFPLPGFRYQLDPSYEPVRCDCAIGKDGYIAPNIENTSIFAILQKYNRVNLVVPEKHPHMWNTAMEGGACVLTALGEHYRRLVAEGHI